MSTSGVSNATMGPSSCGSYVQSQSIEQTISDSEVRMPVKAWQEVLHRVGYGEPPEELQRLILGIPGVAPREDSGALALRLSDGPT